MRPGVHFHSETRSLWHSWDQTWSHQTIVKKNMVIFLDRERLNDRNVTTQMRIFGIKGCDKKTQIGTCSPDCLGVLKIRLKTFKCVASLRRQRFPATESSSFQCRHYYTVRGTITHLLKERICKQIHMLNNTVIKHQTAGLTLLNEMLSTTVKLWGCWWKSTTPSVFWSTT